MYGAAAEVGSSAEGAGPQDVERPGPTRAMIHHLVGTRLWGSSGLRSFVAAWWPTALRFVVCFNLLVSAGLLAYTFVRPSWNAFGLPSYIGYGKNVERAALILTVVGVVASSFASFGRGAVFVILAWLAGVLAVLKSHSESKRALASLVVLVFVNSIYLTWYDSIRDDARPEPERSDPRWHLILAIVLLACSSSWLFLLAFHPNYEIDLHHHGEIIASALDLLHGGIPFRTFFWPHGLSDTAVSALLISWTGNKGMGNIYAMVAIWRVLSLVTLFLLAWGLLRRPLHACLFAVLMALLWDESWRAAGSLIPMICFAILCRQTGPASHFVVGCLLGLGYLWRIDTGVFAIVTTATFLVIDQYYIRGYARDGCLWHHVLDPGPLRTIIGAGSTMALGLGCSLVLFRVFAGFPTEEWFRTTLIDLPRHHADSTGFPLPLALKDVIHYGSPWDWKPRAIGLPAILLLLVGLFAFTLRKVIGGRLPVASPRDRYFLLLLIYGAYNVKTIMNRSDTYHLLIGSWILFMVCLLDILYSISRGARSSRVALTTVGCCLAGALFLPSCLYGGWPRLPLPRAENLAVLRESFSPTVTWRGMLAPTTDPNGSVIEEGTEQVRRLLELHGVGQRELLVYHSAALLYPLFDRELPTKYYQLGWAADARMEHDLIRELQRNRVRAFLHVRFLAGSMEHYDVPNSYRMPIVHRYITERESSGRAHETRLGKLTVIDNK